MQEQQRWRAKRRRRANTPTHLLAFLLAVMTGILAGLHTGFAGRGAHVVHVKEDSLLGKCLSRVFSPSLTDSFSLSPDADTNYTNSLTSPPLSQLLTAGLASLSSSHPLPVHRRVPCPPSTSPEDTDGGMWAISSSLPISSSISLVRSFLIDTQKWWICI